MSERLPPDKVVLKGNEAVQIECWFIGDFREKEPENAQGQVRLKIVGMFKKDADKSKVSLIESPEKVEQIRRLPERLWSECLDP